MHGNKDVVLWNPLLTAEAQQVGMRHRVES
jgi:hypothetical protein